MAMTWLQRLTLGEKFLTAFALLLLLLGLSLAAILFYLSRINSYVDRHKRITVPAITSAGDMQHHIYEVTLRAHMLTDSGAAPALDGLRGDISRHLDETRRLLDVYRSTHAVIRHPVTSEMLDRHGRSNLSAQEDAFAQKISGQLLTLQSGLNAAISMVKDGRKADAHAALAEIDALSRRIIEEMGGLIDVHADVDAEMKIEGDSLLFQAKLVILALVLLLGLVIVTAYIVVNRHIAWPLRRLAATADRVAHHDLTAGFDPWPAKDEVGNLTQSLGAMLAHIRERTHALERKTRELESFTYSVAHDLKSPLREIEGFSSLLGRKFGRAMEPTALHYVTVIHTSALRLTALIDDLLRYSRLEQQALTTTQVQFTELIDQVVEERVSLAGGRRPDILIDLPYRTVTGEPASIRQALANLIDNAIKFSRDADPGRITVGGAATRTERIVWIRDNGIGIDPEQAHRIFGLFERLHGPEEYEGTGVGLAIVKLVMDKHRGRVWVESSPGKGSTFFLAFPHMTDPSCES